MLGQLVAFCLLWNFVLFLAPGPAYGNFESGGCTVEDSPGKIVCAHIMCIILYTLALLHLKMRINGAMQHKIM